MSNRIVTIIAVVVLFSNLMFTGCRRSLLSDLRDYSEFRPPEKPSIQYAAMQGNLPKVKSMLAENPEPTDPIYATRTLLHWAAYGGSKEVAEYLINKGFNVNVMDGKTWRPLHVAIIRGHKDVVEVLIAHGARVNEFAECGTPLYHAVREGREDIASLLLENAAGVNARDNILVYGERLFVRYYIMPS